MKPKSDILPYIVSGIIFVCLSFLPGLSARTFTAKNGKTLEAKLLLVQGNYVKLLKEDAQAIWVNTLLLTDHDQNFIRKQGVQSKTMKARNLRYIVNAAQHIDRLVESKLRIN